MKNIKILAVLPYSELQPLFSEAIQNFPEIELYTYSGYYTNAFDYMKEFPGIDFDAIISRGGTADLLNQFLQKPVIKIDITAFDILRSLETAKQFGGSIAFVSFPSVTALCRSLCEITGTNIQIYTVTSSEDNNTFDFSALNTDVIVGGALTLEMAKNHCKHTVLLRSTKESVHAALEQAIQAYRCITKADSGSPLFQTIVERSSSGVLIFDEGKHVCYANQAYYQLNIPNLDLMLQRSIPALFERKKISRVKKVQQSSIEIIGQYISSSSSAYYLFYIRLLRSSHHKSPALHIEEFTDDYQSSTFFGSSYLRPLSNYLDIAETSNLPILLEGEDGCGKTVLAHYLHRHSSNQFSSFVTVDCSQLTVKEWNNLVNDPLSPLNSVGYTFFFQDLTFLSLSLQKSIVKYMQDTMFTRRNRTLSASSKSLESLVLNGSFRSDFYTTISGIKIKIPPLRTRFSDIPQLIEMLIARYNIKLSKNVITIDSDALDYLCSYNWPMNFEQIDRTIRQLIITNTNNSISLQDVEQILGAETQGLLPMQNTAINLSGTLEDIEKRIIQQVLQEENMNHTSAAKRLNISRSTIWRKIAP